MRRLATKIIFAAALTCSSAWSRDQVRIDGSSAAAADQSFQRMVKTLKPDEQQALVIALIQINLAGAQSAQDMLRNPNMQNPSAGQVRDRIAGMTAPEIIAFANKAATTKAFVEGQEPGVPTDLLRPLASGPPSHNLTATVWVVENNVNGHINRGVYEFHADHTLKLIESDLTEGGTSRWEQAGHEVRLSFSDGYAVDLGQVSDATTMKGDGGNKVGFRWTWTATKR